MIIIIKATEEARQYYQEHKGDPSCDFSRFSRSVTKQFSNTRKDVYETKITVFIRYFLQSRFEVFKKKFCLCNKTEALEDFRTGRALIPVYQSEEPLQIRKKFIQCVRKVIQQGLGKGLEKIKKQGFKGRLIEENYWSEEIDPDHYDKTLSHKLFNAWKESSTPLSYQEWRKTSRCHALIAYFQIQPDIRSGGLCSRIDLTKIQIHHFTAKERKKYLVHLKSFPNQKTTLLDIEENPLTEKTLIYVIDADQNIYAAEKEEKLLHHSSFLNGGAVICAGRLSTNFKGEISRISNESGHYYPTEENFRDALTVFKSKGLDIEEGVVRNTTLYFLNWVKTLF